MFKDSKGGWKTKSLFVEMLGVEGKKKHNPPYTLHEADIEKNGKAYKSLYQIFMSCADEYEFATKHLGGTAHWESMQKSNWFYDGYRGHKGVQKWRDDMRARDESLAKKVLMDAAMNGDVPAAKKLFDLSKKAPETKRGRFVKEEARKEAAKKVEEDSFFEDAALRLNVVKIRD